MIYEFLVYSLIVENTSKPCHETISFFVLRYENLYNPVALSKKTIFHPASTIFPCPTNFALNKEIRLKKFPFSKLAGHDVNTLIFPNLDSGNIAYKMMQEIGGAEVIGPVIMGMNRPVHILQMESNVREIIYLAAIAVVDAQCSSDPRCASKFALL